MTTPLAFIDCETTGLDADLHQVWECGLVLRTDDPVPGTMPEVTNDPHQPGDYWFRWFLPVDLSRADRVSLDIGGYHDRHPYGDRSDGRGLLLSPDIFATTLAMLTAGAHLVGAVVSFDEERLRRLLQSHGAQPSWHYHLVDVENLAAGYLAREALRIAAHGSGDEADDAYGVARPPWDSEGLSRGVGVNPDHFQRHTALGDALWARAVYDRVMG